jgi:hypothetical protein
VLNLSHFETLCHRLTIKDRDAGHHRAFQFNPSQQKIMRAVYKRQEQKKPLWLIFLKARRLGISTWVLALLMAQQLQKKNCQGMIVAQLGETAKELFRQVSDFSECLPFKLPPHTQREIYFPHSGGVSSFRRATAKTVISGRGLTLNGLHMTEAAFYPGADSFIALLNTVSSKDPDNIVAIETTANGMEGPGEAYYDYWNAAVDGQNNFMPIFLPWYEDPGSIMPDELAPDAPADDYEKWLMKEFKVTKGQIAWFRQTLETKCGGSIYTWRAEYPATPEESFISTGNPAFDFQELKMAQDHVTEPICNMRMVPINSKWELTFEESREGPLEIWEWPKEGDHYYVGVDAAKGMEDGDFAAAVGWNAETGRQAFRYAARVGPEILGSVVNWIGRMYDKAMVNVEITGGWGYIVLRELRDRWHYPGQYLWLGRDDRFDKKPRTSLGWETTERSRQRALALFRTSLRRGECFPLDQELVTQMSKCKMEMGWRWTVIKGHDDIMMAALLGWAAMQDHHYPHGAPLDRMTQKLTEEKEQHSGITWMDSPESNAAGMFGWTSTNHLNKLRIYNDKAKKKDLLQGI